MSDNTTTEEELQETPPEEELTVVEQLNLPDRLKQTAQTIDDQFGDTVTFTDSFGELTVEAPVDQLTNLFAFAKSTLQVQYLIDVSAVHWPAGYYEAEQELATSGWPHSTVEQDGHFDVVYILRSLTPPNRFRIRIKLSDIDPVVPSADPYWRSANFMEREVYDLMGISFTDHPNLTRIMMPDEWVGHPLRKDYGLGGVEVEFDGKTVPPADERDY